MLALLSLFISGFVANRLWRRFAGPSLRRLAWPAGLILGPTFASVLIYALYVLCARIGIQHPLLAANLTVHLPLIALSAYLLRPTLHTLRTPSGRTRFTQRYTVTARSQIRQRFRIYTLVVLALSALFGLVMTWGSFYFEGDSLMAGVSVFSDFAPHTAMMRSFSEGLNVPTSYPHFAGDGIAHHFLFFFMCGNLNFLGLPLSWAINLPSVLAVIVCTHLLGTLAVLMTRKWLTYGLAPLFLWFRSSLSWWRWLDMIRDRHPDAMAAYPSVPSGHVEGPLGLGEAWRIMITGDRFVGPLPRDDWGLFASNVYANQRHLIWGLCLMFLVIFLWIPALRKGVHDVRGTRFGALTQFAAPRNWRGLRPGPLLISLLTLVTFPYWHGSTLIVLLMVLFVMALVSRHKGAYLIMAGTAIVSSFALTAFFQGEAARTITPTFLWGFLLGPDATLLQVMGYLFTLFGFGFILMLVLPPFMPHPLGRTLSMSVYLPLIFALTVSLTNDVTVNHKYLMLAYTLATPAIAGLVARLILWGMARIRAFKTASPDLQATRNVTRGALSILLAVILVGLLTINGFIDLKTYRIKNVQAVGMDTSSAFVHWIESATPPDSVFMTPPWAYHSFFYTGRQSYYGHSYYAWSAGHDTDRRLALQNRWLDGSLPTETWTHEAALEGIDYLIVTQGWLTQNDPSVNAPHHLEGLTPIAHFPEMDDARIYQISAD